MFMKKQFYQSAALVFFCTFLILTGCKKSSSPSSPGNTKVNGLIASRTEVNTTNGTSTTTVYTYSYDGQNRLIGFQETNQTPVTYVYGNDTVTETQGSTVTVYALNSAGLAVSDNQGNTYTYNSAGYLTNLTNISGASTVNIVSNGNIVNSVVTTAAGVSTTYSYTFLSTTEYRSVGVAFLGAGNTNVPQSETISSLGAFPFSYTFDSEGRVKTLKIISGASTLVSTYAYED
jgi:hypothetical protein